MLYWRFIQFRQRMDLKSTLPHRKNQSEVSFLSCSLMFVVYKFSKKTNQLNFSVYRPPDKDLEKYFDKVGKLPNHAAHHVLNTPKALKNLSKEISAYCFTGGAENVVMFAGYSDGLILKYEIQKILADKSQQH